MDVMRLYMYFRRPSLLARRATTLEPRSKDRIEPQVR